MISREKLEDTLTKCSIVDSEKAEFIGSYITNKSCDDVMSVLLKHDPNEQGGSVAITGFYYQFLVYIDYMIELYKGKWDFVGIELHDDIIACKNNKIKIIQVKSSIKNYMDVTNTNLYTRTLKKSDSDRYYCNDSWIDKLLKKAEYFKKDDGYEIEFELVTSYEILSTPKINIDHFKNDIKNRDRVEKDNVLYSKLMMEVFDKETGDRYDYYLKTGYELTELLDRFYIIKRSNVKSIKEYERNLRSRIGEIMFPESEKNLISLPNNLLFMLIGIISSRCKITNEKRTFIMDKEEFDEIIKKIRRDTIQDVKELINSISCEKCIGDIFSVIDSEYRDFGNVYSNVKDKIDENYCRMLKWIDDIGGTLVLLNRYIVSVTITVPPKLNFGMIQYMYKELEVLVCQLKTKKFGKQE